MLLRAQRPKEALAEAEAVLAADPQNRFALDLKAARLRDLRRFDEARRGRRQAARGRPQRPQGRLPEGDGRGGAPRLRGARRPLLEEILARPRRRERREDAGNGRVFLVHLGFAYQQLGRHRTPRERSAQATRDGRRARREPARRSTSRRCRSPQGRPRRSPRRAPRASASPTTPTSPRSRPTLLRETGRQGRRDGDRRRRCARSRPTRPSERARCAWPTSTSAPSASPRPRPRCARRARSSRKNLATLFQLGAVLERQKRHDAAEARLPRGAGRRARVRAGAELPRLHERRPRRAGRRRRCALIEKAVAHRPRERRLPGQPGLGALPAGPPGRRPRSYAAPRRRERDAGNAVVLDHLGDIARKPRHACAEALGVLAAGRSTGEDDDERARPRRAWSAKIREAQAGAARPSSSAPYAAHALSVARRRAARRRRRAALRRGLPAPAVVDAGARRAVRYSGSLRVSAARPRAARPHAALLVAFAGRTPCASRSRARRARAWWRWRASGRLTAVFPAERARLRGRRRRAGELEALLGVALTPARGDGPALGAPPPRLPRTYARDWGATLPRRIDADAADGARARGHRRRGRSAASRCPTAAFDAAALRRATAPIDAEEARRLAGSGR